MCTAKFIDWLFISALLKALLLILAMGSMKAVASDSLVVLTEEFPPYNYKEDEQLKGLSTEVVQAVLKEAGIKAKIASFPWARAYKLAETRENHLIYSIARIPEREELFFWIGPIAPYKTSFYKLFSRRDIHIAQLDDAKQYSIGCSRDDVITQYLQSQNFSKLSVVSRDSQNIPRLKAGLVDLIAFDEASFPYHVKLHEFNQGLFRQAYRIEALSDDLYMAMNKNSNLQLVEKIQQALERIKSSGKHQEIVNKYLLHNPP